MLRIFLCCGIMSDNLQMFTAVSTFWDLLVRFPTKNSIVYSLAVISMVTPKRKKKPCHLGFCSSNWLLVQQNCQYTCIFLWEAFGFFSGFLADFLRNVLATFTVFLKFVWNFSLAQRVCRLLMGLSVYKAIGSQLWQKCSCPLLGADDRGSLRDGYQCTHFLSSLCWAVPLRLRVSFMTSGGTKGVNQTSLFGNATYGLVLTWTVSQRSYGRGEFMWLLTLVMPKACRWKW